MGVTARQPFNEEEYLLKSTAEQKAAIRERSKTLLVSASAGAGKTATLTKRIIVSLCDEKDPADISRMLVVTFTNAAVDELRTRIRDAVTEQLTRDPENAHLAEQLLLLPSAKIKTIDGFCADIVRYGASILGISPEFRICDEAEGKLLAHEVMDDLIDEGYAGELTDIGISDFAAFADDIAGVRDDANLSDIFLSLTDSLLACREETDVLKESEDDEGDENKKSPFDFAFGKSVRTRLLRFLDHILPITEQYAKDLKKGNSHYAEAFMSDAENYEKLRDALIAEDYSAAQAMITGDFYVSLAAKRNAPELRDLRTEAKGFRDTCKATMQSYCKDFFAYSADFMVEIARKNAFFTRTLRLFLKEFITRFRKEKRERGICDYADLEHYAFLLLYDENGRRTQTAEGLSAAYDAVYIDEYQDVNSLQHAIFSAIAREDNLFMVGDVKQSIYSFRHAEPSIFVSLRNTFPMLSEAKDGNNAVQILPHNFRSDLAIINAVNAVCDPLMTAVRENIAYDPETDRLLHGKSLIENAPPECGVTPTFRLFLKPPKRRSAEDFSASDMTDDEQKVSVTNPEVRYIAEEILSLTDGNHFLANGDPIKFGDITILLKTVKNVAPAYAEGLRGYGIPCHTDEDRDFFLNPEILLVLSLLHTIDNPHRDIYLAGTLRSPLYRFTADDLIRIRKSGDRYASLYENCLAYHEKEKDPKLSLFFSDLARFRDLATGTPIDRLLSILYHETGLLLLAENRKNGENARENLLLLHHYARDFKASSYRGLSSFLSFVDEVLAEKPKLSKGTKTGGDAVRILSVHAAKGLDLPVVFLADCARAYHESPDGIRFSPKLGVAVSFRDRTGLARYPNPIQKIIEAENRESGREEEIRVLYVALTRAKERLTVVGTACVRKDELAGDAAENYLSRFDTRRKHLSEAEVLNCQCFRDLILTAIPKDHPALRIETVPVDENGYPLPEGATFGTLSQDDETRYKDEVKEIETAEENASTETEEAQSEAAESKTPAPVTAEELKKRFDYQYEYAAVSALPSKLSVSRLAPDVLDDGDSVILDEYKPPLLPRFLAERETSAAERGTATHLFMQFCDFARLESGDVEAELSSLVEKRFLSHADAEKVFTDELRLFCHSDFFRRLRNAKELYREFRFHARLRAADFTEDAEKKKALAGETILVQGVIDCIAVEEDGSILLADYKTDRLTAYEQNHKEAAAQKLAERHKEQLYYYAEAVKEIFGRAPKELLIYSLPLGEAVHVAPARPKLPE